MFLPPVIRLNFSSLMMLSTHSCITARHASATRISVHPEQQSRALCRCSPSWSKIPALTGRNWLARPHLKKILALTTYRNQTAMTSLSPSSSEQALDLLDERIRRWIWEKGWTELRDIQAKTIEAVLHT